MNRALFAPVAAFLVAGCAHDPPPRAPLAEEPIVMAASPSKAKPLPEIDPNKPLSHHKEIDTTSGQPTCWRSGRRMTTCK